MHRPTATPTCRLEDPVQFLRGVGPRRAQAYARLGIHTLEDLVHHYPMRHEHVPASCAIGRLRAGPATVIGALRRVRTRRSRSGPLLSAMLVDGTGTLAVRWFNSPFLVDRLLEGTTVRLSGKVEPLDGTAGMTNPTVVVVDPRDALRQDRDQWRAVYPATAELSSHDIARAIAQVLDAVAEQVREFLPPALLRHRRLPGRAAAIVRYHQPGGAEDIAIARRRLAYEELLLFQLALRIRRRQAVAEQARPIRVTPAIDRRIRARLPFVLTAGQEQAIREISDDLARPVPMNRLLQGDVGAGKTAVAVYAALAAIAGRRQVALLAPTEVLARQHLDKLRQYLRDSRVNIQLLVGSTSRRERAIILPALRGGTVDLLIGTHALIEEKVAFHDLGLVVIDEQHKFGVRQRAALREKAGGTPHTLVLTATPIPRTLAMTLFGDLDVSTIPDRPPGRGRVDTRLVTPQYAAAAFQFVRDRLAAGEQAYVVYPVIGEASPDEPPPDGNSPVDETGAGKTVEPTDLKGALREAQRLARHELRGFSVGLLHGRMRPAEKNDVMESFRAGRVQALVATTVIEVGVDVPNATLMLIHHADRYGLSQLHQLRGRIGRGAKRSFCLLFVDDAAEAALGRLRMLVKSDDGFRIAEEDLRIRGPGELLGTRQHGIPMFRAANLADDLELVTQARDDAVALLTRDPRLQQPAHKPLRAALLAAHGTQLRLALVG